MAEIAANFKVRQEATAAVWNIPSKNIRLKLQSSLDNESDINAR